VATVVRKTELPWAITEADARHSKGWITRPCSVVATTVLEVAR